MTTIFDTTRHQDIGSNPGKALQAAEIANLIINHPSGCIYILSYKESLKNGAPVVNIIKEIVSDCDKDGDSMYCLLGRELFDKLKNF